jgi:hypothetical protein
MHPAPLGALCAVHVGIAASSTCARCGNFMCSTCSEQGSQPQCPSCRSLAGGQEFPLDANSDFSAMWGHSVAAWQPELVMLSVCTIIFFAITFGGSMIASVINSVVNAVLGIGGDDGLSATVKMVLGFVVGQFIGTIVSIVVQGVALVGLYRVLLDVLEGRKADVARMFSQFHLLPRYLVLQVIFFVALTIPILGGMGAIALVAIKSVGISLQDFSSGDFERLLNPSLFGLFMLFSVVVLVGSIVVMPVTLFSVPELIVGNCSPVEAITRSWNLGSGQRLRLIGYGFVSGLVVMAGALLCLVGMIPALPLAYMLLLALYLGLRKSAGLPTPAGS